MKNLLEVARIITKKKIRKIEVFDEATLENKSSKFSEFYEALLAGKFKNDRDAATFLYNCSPTDDKYRQLKSRFRKRLLNTLFFLDVNSPDSADYDRAYYSCNKEWTLVKTLIANSAHSVAEELTKQILNTALKFKFSDVIVNCSRILRLYAAEAENFDAFEEYDRYIKQFANVLEAEIRSEELYERVVMGYKTPAKDIETLIKQIDVYCQALVGLSETYDSPIVVYNMFLVWTFRYEMMMDFADMLQVCQRAETYIENNPNFYQEDKQYTFQIKKMSAYLHLQDFKNGKTAAEKALQTFEEGSEVWFNFMEYYILQAFHTDNYIQALAILNRSKNQSKFKKLGMDARERWKIYETYLNYFLDLGVEEESPLKTQVKKSFKLSRFLNDSILYPKEQRVFTVHLVIAQVLFLLDQKKFLPAREKIDRLKSYANKQLNSENNARMVYFIRLLVLLEKADFQPLALDSTDKIYDLMVGTPFFYRGLINEFEVVPYEKLWNHILEKLS